MGTRMNLFFIAMLMVAGCGGAPAEKDALTVVVERACAEEQVSHEVVGEGAYFIQLENRSHDKLRAQLVNEGGEASEILEVEGRSTGRFQVGAGQWSLTLRNEWDCRSYRTQLVTGDGQGIAVQVDLTRGERFSALSFEEVAGWE